MSCDCDEVYAQPLWQEPVEDNKCLTCQKYFHPFNWRYSCKWCGQSYCRKCCKTQFDKKKKIILCERCIFHRYHGASPFCQKFDECIRLNDGNLFTNKYQKMDKYGTHLFWKHTCKHGKNRWLSVGTAYENHHKFECTGHWDNNNDILAT